MFGSDNDNKEYGWWFLHPEHHQMAAKIYKAFVGDLWEKIEPSWSSNSIVSITHRLDNSDPHPNIEVTASLIAQRLLITAALCKIIPKERAPYVVPLFPELEKYLLADNLIPLTEMPNFEILKS